MIVNCDAYWLRICLLGLGLCLVFDQSMHGDYDMAGKLVVVLRDA